MSGLFVPSDHARALVQRYSTTRKAKELDIIYGAVLKNLGNEFINTALTQAGMPTKSASELATLRQWIGDMEVKMPRQMAEIRARLTKKLT